MKNSGFRFVSWNVIALSIVSAMFISSCDKTEVPVLGLNRPVGNVTKGPVSANGDVAPSTSRYVLVSIDHQPGYSVNPTPSYIITLYNNGDVVFRGINDVAKIGTYNYNVSLDVVNNIQNLLSPVMYNIKDILTVVPDAPNVETTYQLASDIAPITLIDNGQNYPAQLITLRKQVETMLKDQFYVGNLIDILNNSQVQTETN